MQIALRRPTGKWSFAAFLKCIPLATLNTQGIHAWVHLHISGLKEYPLMKN